MIECKNYFCECTEEQMENCSSRKFHDEYNDFSDEDDVTFDSCYEEITFE